MRLILLLAALAVPAFAGAGEVEHDRARRLVEEGAIMPLERLLPHIDEYTAGGQLLEVELEEEHGRLVYEIELLEPTGRVIELLFDAKTAELLRKEVE